MWCHTLFGQELDEPLLLIPIMRRMLGALVRCAYGRSLADFRLSGSELFAEGLKQQFHSQDKNDLDRLVETSL